MSYLPPSSPPTGRPPRAVRRFGALLLAGALGLLGGVATGATSAAAATTVPVCSGTTTVPVAPELLTLSGFREADYLAGKAVPLYMADGTFGVHGGVPACTVRRIDGEAVSDWAYCTDADRGACTGPTYPNLDLLTGNPKLDVGVDPLGPDKEKVIAYLAQHDYPLRNGGVDVAGNATTAQRQTMQFVIWCVSEAGPGLRTDAGSAFCRENFDDDDFAAVLGRIPSDPTLRVEGPTQPLEAGDVARFTVRTNVVDQPIAVSVDGAASWVVCEGDATFAHDTLTVHGPDAATSRTVVLCATTTGPGTVDVALRVTPASDRNLVWSWNGDVGCQVYATFVDVTSATLAAAGRAEVRATPTTPTTPEAPTVPVTPATPTTPAVAPERVERISTLRITKRSARTRHRPGQRVVYRIRVTNPSRRTVRNVRVCDVMPRGLAFVGASRKAERRNGRHCWTIGRLAPRTTTRLRVVTRVLAGAPSRITNRVTAQSPDARRTATARHTIRVERSVAPAGGVTG